MNYIPQAKIKTVSEQEMAIRHRHPDFIVKSTRHSLKISGWNRPTARSVVYQYEITYSLLDRPAIRIIDPILEKYEAADELPHVYPGDELCLYYPYYGEFTHRELLTETVIPWIALWIFYYEKWAVTGKWLGGGIH